MPAYLENSAVATGLEKLFLFQAQRKAMQKNVQTIAQLAHLTHQLSNAQKSPSQASKKIVNCELLDVQSGFIKGRGTRDQIFNIHWIIKKARESKKNIFFCFTYYVKAFYCVDNKKMWKILKEMGIPDHLICLLRNLYAGQEATVRTGHETAD